MAGLFDFGSVDEEQIQLSRKNAGPVTQVTQWKVPAASAEQLKHAWEADAVLLREQPGCISVQLHRGVGEKGVFLSYIVWRSVEHFLKAMEAFAQAHNTHVTYEQYPQTSDSSTQILQIMPIGGGNICDASRNVCADHRSATDPMNPDRSTYAIEVTAGGGTVLSEPPLHDHWIRFDISSTGERQAANLCMAFTLSLEEAHALGVWLAEKSARLY